MKAVVSEFMEEDILRDGLAPWDVLYRPELVDDRQGLLDALADADALIVRNRTRVNADLLARAPRLRVVGRLGVGLDNIDLAACKAAGIAVCPATGANDVSVAEYVIGAALVLLRGVFASPSRLAQGDWARNALMGGREMRDKRLGLVGFGAIARETAARGLAMGMHVAAHDPFVAADDTAWATPLGRITPASLDQIVTQSDVISLHVPLTEQTRHLIGADAIAAMKQGAIVINAARGGVLDEAALVQALASGKLGGAALDVFETEPLPADQARAFDGLSNVILTPHIAGLSQESNRRVSEMTVAAVRTHLMGGA